MEGSVGVAPAAADANGQVDAPQAEPTAPDPTQVPGAEETTDPNSPEARLAAAEARAKAAEDKLAQNEPAAETDLLSALEGEDDLAVSPEDLAAFQNGEQPNAEEATDAQVKEFEDYLSERIQEALTPLQQERQVEKIQAWSKDNPDVVPGTKLGDQVIASMEKFEAKYPGAKYDVETLDEVATAARAKLADAGATPAESAANRGASLETQPGGSQTGEPNEEQSYKEQLLRGSSSDGAGFR
jgi:hypothetical protein